MRQILLTQGKFTIVDDDVYEWAKDYKWQTKKDGSTFYAVRHFYKEDGTRSLMYLHQAIIGYNLDKLIVDHRDGNGLNNQRFNLRFATRRKNASNHYLKRLGLSSSKYTGVSWSKKHSKWEAHIKINGKKKFLGLFIDEDQAHLAYETVKNKLDTLVYI